MRPTFDVLVSNDDGPKEEGIKIVEKLHKQFGHQSVARLKSLLKDAGVNDDSILEHVGHSMSIHHEQDTQLSLILLIFWLFANNTNGNNIF